tara:strand:+ start:1434 stop:2357 length:924 start_codon:yes stop_codon:yes gene_type:complete
MLISFFYFIAGLVMLYYGAEYLIDYGKKIAFIFNISPIVVGITIVAFGTSLPEMVVSIIANINGDSGIALGNVIGSNISNIGLVLGLTALIKPIQVKYENSKFDLWFLSVVSILLIIFCNYFILNSLVGLTFLFCLAIYLRLIIQKKRIIQNYNTESENLYFLILIILLSSIILFLGTQYFIKGAKGIANIFGINGTVVGLTIIAFGTSAPELSASFIAMKKQDFDIILGNIIGSNIFNILAVLGVTTLIKPIVVQNNIESVLIIFILLTLILPMILYLRNKLSRIVGFLFFNIYLFFLYQSFFNIN